MPIRSLLITMLFIMGAILVGCQETTQTKPSIAIVDWPRLLNDSEPGKAGIAYLENLQKNMQEKLNTIHQKLEKDPNSEELQQEAQSAFMMFQGRITKEQQNVTAKLYDMLQKLADEYRAKTGLSMIITKDAAVSFDGSIDITSALMQEANKQKVTFEPLETEEKEGVASAPVASEPAKQNADTTTEKNAEKK